MLKLKALLPVFTVVLFALSIQVSAKTESSIFVSTEWVNQHQEKLVLIDLSSQSSYQKFHLPNAIWVNYAWLIRPQNGIALSGGVDYMVQVLSELGIKNEDHIVIYDDMGNLDASRLYWELKKLQHPKVSLMDGGTVAWILDGYKVTQTVPERLAKTIYRQPKTNLTDTLTADQAEVLAAIKDSNTILLDIRTEAEYIGNPKQQRSGHIPTAVWFDWTLAVNAYDGFKQDKAQALLKQLAQINIKDKNQPIIH